MENLGPGVRDVVYASNNPDRTIDLSQLSRGDKLFIKVGEREKDMLNYVITEPARQPIQGVSDSAWGRLPGWKWSSKLSEELVDILIAGSCTLNRTAPLGFTMLTIGRITVGRNIACWLGKTEDFTVFVTPIQEITLWKVETQS